MKIQQIRNATLKITYGGHTFLIDPWLLPKGAFGTFRGKPFRPLMEGQEDIPMPCAELPFPKEDVLLGVDACIITHIHPDHIDMTGVAPVGDSLPRKTPTFVQSPEDAQLLWDEGFTDLTSLYENSAYKDVELIRTECRHGTRVPCGPACGVVFRHSREKTLYLAGDTIWYAGVHRAIERHRPEVIILNACGASLKFFGRLIMDAEDVLKVHEAAPEAKLVVSHLESVAHATLTRSDIRAFAREKGFEKSIVIPADGETLDLD